VNQDILSSRYGEKRSNPKRFRVFALIGVAVLVAITAYFALGNNQGFSYKDVGFSVISEFETVVEIEISKPKDKTVVCSVEALNGQFGTVGWKELEFGPAEFTTLRHTISLNTTELAVTGLVDECRLR
jgi:hypothetical protein